MYAFLQNFYTSNSDTIKDIYTTVIILYLIDIYSTSKDELVKIGLMILLCGFSVFFGTNVSQLFFIRRIARI